MKNPGEGGGLRQCFQEEQGWGTARGCQEAEKSEVSTELPLAAVERLSFVEARRQQNHQEHSERCLVLDYVTNYSCILSHIAEPLTRSQSFLEVGRVCIP